MMTIRIQCDANLKCSRKENIVNENANSSLCCNGNGSVSNILLNGTNGIRCDAYSSCGSSNITIVNDGNLYATAHISCSNCKINATS